jgi:hypothetical protein
MVGKPHRISRPWVRLRRCRSSRNTSRSFSNNVLSSSRAAPKVSVTASIAACRSFSGTARNLGSLVLRILSATARAKPSNILVLDVLDRVRDPTGQQIRDGRGEISGRPGPHPQGTCTLGHLRPERNKRTTDRLHQDLPAANPTTLTSMTGFVHSVRKLSNYTARVILAHHGSAGAQSAPRPSDRSHHRPGESRRPSRISAPIPRQRSRNE